MRVRAGLELVLAVVALVGCVVSAWMSGSANVAAPVTAGEPSRDTMVYDPTLILVALILATAAGVLGVLGVARLRRR